ncbi:trypsin-like peptidase domain-containing protein [Rhodovarius sp.]|uniref:trypsin-like serine peptidase n=1 Tax=Rhodovarius sp. TaxID=2972673 RepID=UPI00333E5E82
MRLILPLLLLLAGPAAAEEPPRIPPSTLPGIGGEDRRVLLPQPARPWSALGRVQTGLGNRCTGTLIAPDRVLTAAHCLVAPRTANFVQPRSLRFLLGYRMGWFQAAAEARAYHVGDGFNPATNGPAGADWAIIELAQPLHGPMLPLWQGGIPPGTPLMLGGYQQDRPEVILADTDCRAGAMLRQPKAPSLLAHDCSATRGASGAPLIALLPDGRHVVAGVAVRAALGAARGFAVPAEAIRSLHTRE